MLIRWSTFRSAEDNAPVPCEGTWEEFSALLTTRHAPPISGRLAGEKKGMPSFAPAVFRESSRRATENASTLHLLAFDVDNAIEEPTGEYWDEKRTRPKLRKVPVPNLARWEHLSEILRAKGVAFRGYTSWSHTDEWPKFRIVVPLKAPITPEVWESATEVALRDLGLEPWRKSIDVRALRDVARMYFLPGAPPEKDVAFFGEEGEPYWIDTERLDRVEVPAIPKNSYARPKPAEEVNWIAYGIEMPGLRLKELLEALGCVVGRPRQLEDGATKWRSTCPWGAEHSHGADSDDAVVIETPGKWPHWGCAHSGHAHLGLQDLLDLAVTQGLKLTDFAPALESDAESLINALSPSSGVAEISKALQAIVKVPRLLQERYLSCAKKATGLPVAALRAELDSMVKSSGVDPSMPNMTSDLGRRVAEDMLDRYFAGGAHLIQTLDKSWWAYTGTHWRRMPNDNALRNYLLNVIKDMVIEKNSESSVLDSSFKILCALQARDQDLLRLSSQQPRVVNCRNGELWIDDDGRPTLRPHEAESYLTYVLDVDFDPRASCPTFEQALRDTFAEDSDPEDMVRHFGEFMGYTIQPRRDQKTWWLFQGSGDNGKTKVMQTVQRLMNTSCVLPLRIKDADKNEFSRAAMAGKLLLLDDDVDTGTVLPDGFLKQVSEDKLLSGRNLFQSYFEFVSTVVPVLLCNNFPSCRDLSQATQKRAMVIPFSRKFDRATMANPYPKIWKEEMAGVLNFALAGYQRLVTRGHFLEPASCLVTKRRFLAAANSLVEFIENACDKVVGSRVPSSELYGAFRMWCDREGHTYIPRKGDVERDLISLGYLVDMDSHLKQKVVHGLRPVDASTGTLG